VEQNGPKYKLNSIKWPKLTTTNLKNIVQTTLDSSKHTQKSFLVKLSKRKASSDHYGLDFLW